ncbi:hypothetical protein [Polyangium jinanense]|uniref:Uncharacterized protein n=1 Tax=Polyangium jinanense TaxID=2829994 RepID=A0A9X3XAH6_9BACT|nr:hypothetical protein [Polyangium jinanense]MDC3959281.1 hypothetical protein [Polyangium jinanense]MDC3985690.1 hypothetical protein [Polyangium jinanense]
MGEAFRNGGFGMYPTLFFGIILFGAAIGYARNPGKGRLVLPAVLALLTLTAGFLGFFTGIITTLTYAASDRTFDLDQFIRVVAMGTAESLHNVGLALAMNVIGGIVVAVGAYRRGRMKPEVTKVGASVASNG